MPPNKLWPFRLVTVTVLTPLLLTCQKWPRKHNSHLELIVAETALPGPTGKPELPQAQRVTK